MPVRICLFHPELKHTRSFEAAIRAGKLLEIGGGGGGPPLAPGGGSGGGGGGGGMVNV